MSDYWRFSMGMASLIGEVEFWFGVCELMIESELVYYLLPNRLRLALEFGAFLRGKKLSSFVASTLTSHVDFEDSVPFHVS
ncbi:hypothetical protein NC652_021214 [Populus alba x Populus x berolinensis]|uniref:Uncharacterized protein n=1 Tax=Populus alba x Populus x berolinensis TaxID=444605 RepID=A0AAD6MLS0_9ROSI|nr:hypothetical protein NC652_021214 [Populus alba x Populus x berolinensis]KAJ6987889.1 hypothetical protein NC653_020974 [Populus alba x Populus x berolinensis]